MHLRETYSSQISFKMKDTPVMWTKGRANERMRPKTCIRADTSRREIDYLVKLLQNDRHHLSRHERKSEVGRARERERETFNLISKLFKLWSASFISITFELRLLKLSGTLSCSGVTTPFKYGSAWTRPWWVKKKNKYLSSFQDYKNLNYARLACL